MMAQLSTIIVTSISVLPWPRNFLGLISNDPRRNLHQLGSNFSLAIGQTPADGTADQSSSRRASERSRVEFLLSLSTSGVRGAAGRIQPLDVPRDGWSAVYACLAGSICRPSKEHSRSREYHTRGPGPGEKSMGQYT